MQQPSSDPTLNPPNPPISLRELAVILIKHFDFHEGFYEVGVQFNIAVGSVGPDATQIAPGAVLTVGGVGLSKCPESSPLAVNAAEVNPLRPIPKKKSVRKTASK